MMSQDPKVHTRPLGCDQLPSPSLFVVHDRKNRPKFPQFYGALNTPTNIPSNAPIVTGETIAFWPD